MLRVIPSIFNIIKPNKKLPGIATPTNKAFLKPSVARIIIITIRTAAITLFPSSLKIFLTFLDSSLRNDAFIF